MLWDDFLQKAANDNNLFDADDIQAFLKRFADNGNKSDARVAGDLNISEVTLQRRLGRVYEKFAQSCPALNSDKKGKFKVLRDWLKTEYARHKETGKPNSISNINWQEVCYQVLAEQQLRRKATEREFELNVFVPLGLVERKQQQRRSGDVLLEQVYQLDKEVITQTYKHDEFLDKISQPRQNNNIAIIGEPGAGKTTVLRKIAQFIQEDDKGLAICIQLADLQGQTLKEYLLDTWLEQALPIIKQLSPDAVPSLLEVPEPLKNDLLHGFFKGKMWLLLDGVDEIADASPVEALTTIQTQLRGLLRGARVVLTCRLNVWDASVTNTLSGFDTYKTLEFEEADVKQFIQDWFIEAGKQEQAEQLMQKRGEQLITKLNEAGKERIRELVKNPLRLVLLCQISYRKPSNLPDLPETKAALYQLFTRYFFKWKLKEHLKKEDLTDWDELNEELIQALGKLALAGINSKNRFRLPRSLARQEMGERLFKLAEKLGWLNLVDLEAKTDEPVYAFFHPTFQEYFAALAVEDWQDFLNHNNQNPNPFVKYNNKDCVYRIFEPQWKQVILLWLGREDEKLRKQKEQFIQALVEFEDGRQNFYGCRAYFLAAAGIAEFGDCSKADKIEIVATLIKGGFGYFNEKQEWGGFPEPVAEGARAALQETDAQIAIAALGDLIQNPQYKFCHLLVADSLVQINKSSAIAVEKILVELIGYFQQNESIRLRVASILGKFDKCKLTAINILVELIRKAKDKNTCTVAAMDLVEIDKYNLKNVEALVELLRRKSNDESTRWKVAEILGEIGISKPEDAVDALVELIGNTHNKHTLWKALQSLGKIGKFNQIAVNALVELIKPTNNDNTRLQAAFVLGKVPQIPEEYKSQAIKTLVDLIESPNKNTRLQAAASLWQIAPEEKSRVIDILVKLIKPSNDENTRLQAAASLWQIAPEEKSRVIDILVKLIKCPNKNICLQAAVGLWQIAPEEKSQAIDTFVS